MVETRMDVMISRLTTQMPPPARRLNVPAVKTAQVEQTVKARPAEEAGSAGSAVARIFAKRAFQVGADVETRPALRADEPRGGNLDILA